MKPLVPPRIGYVLKMYPRFSETFILNEILAHEAAGVDLQVISLRTPAEGRFHGALADVRAPVSYLAHQSIKPADLWLTLRNAWHRLPRLPYVFHELLAVEVGDAAQALELAAIAQTRGLTHLHAHFGSVATTVARLASLLTGVPYTFTAHAKDIFHDGVDQADLNRKIEGAGACVTVSDFNLGHLRSAYHATGTKVVRIYNGLDLDVFHYAEPRERPPKIIGVGRLVEKKGFAHLITACKILRMQGRRFTCEIVGTGPLEDALAAQIIESGLEGWVMLKGAVPQTEVRRLVQAASVLAAPCIVGSDGNRDGLPTVLLEAMALGTPCVATPVTGVPEVVRHGETGLLVPEGDPAGLADALWRLVVDAPARCRLARSARAVIEDDFDVHRQVAKLRRVFDLAQPVLPSAELIEASALTANVCVFGAREVVPGEAAGSPSSPVLKGRLRTKHGAALTPPNTPRDSGQGTSLCG